MEIKIRYASFEDLSVIKQFDRHISADELKHSIEGKRTLVMFIDSQFIGWLRYNLFWDNTPFMNMLYLLDGFRGKGFGKMLMNFWEKEMKKLGYSYALTSTQSNENGQFFYRKNGYSDIGSFTLPKEEPELILYKKL